VRSEMSTTRIRSSSANHLIAAFGLDDFVGGKLVPNSSSQHHVPFSSGQIFKSELWISTEL
jgi:hypothetical protein